MDTVVELLGRLVAGVPRLKGAMQVAAIALLALAAIASVVAAGLLAPPAEEVLMAPFRW